MKTPRLALATISLLLVTAPLAGCASAQSAPDTSETMMTPAIEPEFADVGDLDGTTVQLVVGQALVIDTGDLPLDSYEGTIADPAVAEYIQGSTGSGAETKPGVDALAVGTTEVTMSNEQGGIQDVTFTVDVTE